MGPDKVVLQYQMMKSKGKMVESGIYLVPAKHEETPCTLVRTQFSICRIYLKLGIDLQMPVTAVLQR